MTARLRPGDPHVAELGRYILNGLIATAIHYGVLTFNLRVLDMPSAGLANFVAAWFGIASSFIGSRFFVFRNAEAPLVRQAVHFLGLYAAIACVHGLILYIWTDVLQLNYTFGFVLATVFQMVLSYLGNKLLVFSKP